MSDLTTRCFVCGKEHPSTEICRGAMSGDCLADEEYNGGVLVIWNEGIKGTNKQGPLRSQWFMTWTGARTFRDNLYLAIGHYADVSIRSADMAERDARMSRAYKALEAELASLKGDTSEE